MKRLIAEGVRVQMACTSPPYWGLRDYGTAQWEGGENGCDHIEKQARNDVTPERLAERATLYGTGQQAGSLVKPMQFKNECPKCGARSIDQQLGLEATPEAYVANMVEVFRLVRELLADDGTLWLNLGSSYFSEGIRQTGPNDTNRETPGGRGGSFRGCVRRAIVYDTSGKEPASSQARDCLCESLCGACRVAYQTGKAHSNGLRVPMQSPSPCATSHEHTATERDHLPTSDSAHQEVRSANAIPDPVNTEDRAGGQLPASVVSMPSESLQQLREGSRPSDTDDGCQLCGDSLPAFVPACECKTAVPYASRLGPDGEQALIAVGGSTLGTNEIDDSCRRRTQDIVSPYPNFTRLAFKPKDMVPIPWMVAMALQADGWYLRQDIIWSKPNPMPESVTDRCTKSHEYLFLLSKRATYYYDADAIRQQPSGRTDSITSFGKVEKRGESYELDALKGANKKSVWTVSTTPYADAHFATFPPDLIEPCILAGSQPGDTVLDPFLGSGTVGEVCQNLGRQWIGIELNEAYKPLQERRTAQLGMVFV